MKIHHTVLDDTIITEILKKGTADIDGEYLDTVIKTAKEYTAGIFRRLRDHEYDPKLMSFTWSAAVVALSVTLPITMQSELSATRIFVPPQRDMSIWHSFPLTGTVVWYEC